MAIADRIFGDKASRLARHDALEVQNEKLRASLEEMGERQRASWDRMRSSSNPFVRFLAKVFG